MSCGLAVLALLAACSGQESVGPPVGTPRAPRELRFELDHGAFERDGVLGAGNWPLKGEAFTVLACDADLDGDPDVLVNWHVFAPPELFWNEGGRFSRGTAAHSWSLPENRDVPILDGPRRTLLAAIQQRERAGLYLWHSDTIPAWWMTLAGPLPAGSGVLWFETNRPILGVVGLASEAYELRDEHRLRVPLTPELVGERFYVVTKEVGIQVKVRVEGLALPFFVGPDFVELPGPLEFWYRDPHGMAWVDATADRRPDLFVTRGALRGGLGPPADPKFDDLYVARGGSGVPFERVEVPGDYARGRAAQWVDLEGDGQLELYVSAKSSANRLLRFDPKTLRVSDAAHELGLDFRDADSFAWLDLDGDGDDDLVTLDARHGLLAVRNDEGRHFEALDAAALGLRLAPLAADVDAGDDAGDGVDAGDEEDVTRGIDQHDLVLFDLENDGDFDLLVTGWSATGACVLFRAQEGGFVEDTASAGLGAVGGSSQVVVLDLDADSMLDLLVLGRAPRLLHNQQGHLVERPLPEEWHDLGAVVGAACDADGQGGIDVVLAGRELTLARNQSEQVGVWVWLDLRRAGGVPIGAEVRALHVDGSVQLNRVGSTHRSHLSQAHGLIPLASPAENPLRSIEVRFPGGERRQVEVSGAGLFTLQVD